jgi:uncharacterized protein (DUF488 family)
MKTSNFSKNGYDKNAINIASYAPKWFKGKSYLKLAPPGDLIGRYKREEVNSDEYTIEYNSRVLDNLNAVEVYKDLGEDAILLCYEGIFQFCHRRLVAKWLEEQLNITVDEAE